MCFFILTLCPTLNSFFAEINVEELAILDEIFVGETSRDFRVVDLLLANRFPGDWGTRVEPSLHIIPQHHRIKLHVKK